MKRLNGSNGILLININAAIIETLYKRDAIVKNLLIFALFILSETTMVTPLIPNPSRAMLMIMNAKWYHKETDNTLIRVNSSINVLSDTSSNPNLCLLDIISLGDDVFFELIK